MTALITGAVYVDSKMEDQEVDGDLCEDRHGGRREKERTKEKNPENDVSIDVIVSSCSSSELTFSRHFCSFKLDVWVFVQRLQRLLRRRRGGRALDTVPLSTPSREKTEIVCCC